MKLSHLTIAISVALGLAACGGSGSDNAVDNSNKNSGDGIVKKDPPIVDKKEPSDSPDIVQEAKRQTPDMTVQARYKNDVATRKALYTGRNDRQGIIGYQDYESGINNVLPNDPYRENRNTNDGAPAALVDTHYVAGTTKVPDILRSGAIYNYVEKGHVVGSGLFSEGTGVASTNPGAVVADPGFTYAKGSDGRYYRMRPRNTDWNKVSADTRWVPIDQNYATQFTGGSVRQTELVYIPNARLVDDKLGNRVDNVAAVFGADAATRGDRSTTDGKNVVSRYDYRNTGDVTLDGSNIAGGVDGISISNNNDTFDFLLDSFESTSFGVGGTVLRTSVMVNAVPFIAAPTGKPVLGTHENRRGDVRTNNYLAIATARDQFDNPVVTVLANANNKNIPGVGARVELTPAEAAALISLGQTDATTRPNNLIVAQKTVKATADNPIKTWNDVGNAHVELKDGEEIHQYFDMLGNLIYQQTGAARTPGTKLVKVVKDRDYTANDLVKYQDFPALLLAKDGTNVGTGAGVAANTDVLDAVMNGAVAVADTKVVPIFTGNGFNLQRGAVQWNYLSMLGKQYTLESNVTSKTNELDFSSLEVAKKIQDVPLSATLTVLGGKGTTNAGDDKDEVMTVDAGMLKVYNLPYHRSFVNINQDAVDNTGNRGFYDSFNLAANGIGNGRYGALQVVGWETQGVPWNGRAEYTGSSYGIYTDGQFVSGDLELAVEFGLNRAGASGSVINRKLADGTAVPSISLKPIPLIGGPGRNYDTGTQAMSSRNSATVSGPVDIGGVQNAGIWEFQLYGPDAEEVGGLIKYGRNAPISGQLQPDANPNFVHESLKNQTANRAGGYNEVFSGQRKDISVTSNQSQIPTK